MSDRGLSVSGLTFQIGGRTLFEEIDFDIAPGEMVLLCGRSGNGKSSLANVLNGYFPENGGNVKAGHIKLDGKELQHLSVQERSWSVRTIFQHARLSFSMKTLREEMVFCLENAQVAPDEMNAQIEEKARHFQLTYLLDRPFDELSGGELQRAAFVCANLVDAPLYILDEPFANLDDETSRIYVDYIKKLLQRGKAMVVIDHRLDRWEWAKRWLLLDKQGCLHDLSLVSPEKKKELLQAEGVLVETPSVERRRNNESQETVLELEGVHIAHTEVKKRSFFRKKRETMPLLDDVSFSLKKGTLAALIGPSGKGKTTLFKSILNAMPYQGTIRIGGEDIRNLKPADLYSKVGIVFQDPSLQFVQTKVLDEMVLSVRAWKSAEEGREEAAARELLLEHQFEEQLTKSPWLLSQGQQRRLAVLCMTVGKQRLLLVDEPTYGQDAQNAKNIMAKLKELCQAGITCLFTSHDEGLVEAYADEIYQLKDRKVRKQR